MRQPPLGLYVHFPFCVSVCPYCDFVVYGGRATRGPDSQVERLLGALLAEIRLRARGASGPPLTSVYLGGGTPSLMSARQVERLLTEVDRGFGVAGDAELTIEVNPGSDERGDLRGFGAVGVNRLSIGAQTLNASELRRLGRRHSPADVAATVADARLAGFDNVSVDLLYDIPGQTADSWRVTLDQTLALELEHVSAYALTLDDPDADGLSGPLGDHLPLRAGARQWRGRARAEQDPDRAADLFELADDKLSAAGLRWYELSNWSVPGRQSRHNGIYWSGGAWEAVGPGAHAFDGARTRRWNSARLGGYIQSLVPADGSAASLPPGDSETVDARTASAESVVLALRTHEGVAAEIAGDAGYAAAFAWAAQNDLLEPAHDGHVRLSRRGRLLSNEIFARLIPPASSGAGDHDRVENRLGEADGAIRFGDRTADEHGRHAIERIEQAQLQPPA